MAIILDAANVRVEYGKFIALPAFSLQLSAGNLMGLIGPNGAGKTTILKAIAGLIPLEAGRVDVLGERVEPFNTMARSRVGFAPDTPPTYDDMSVENFLRFIGRAYRIRLDMIEERIDFWLDQLWLSDRRASKIKTLSRGMKQRLTVVRTLLPDPPLVLLDEPAAGLDPAGRVSFRKMLGSLRDSGKALIVSSHILADLHEYCTHIGIMEKGQLVQFGTVAQVVGGQEADRCRYRVTLSRAFAESAAVMAGFPVAQLELNGREMSFEFSHDGQEAAELLANLIKAGLPVSSFAPVAHDLEQAYLRTGIRQVD